MENRNPVINLVSIQKEPKTVWEKCKDFCKRAIKKTIAVAKDIVSSPEKAAMASLLIGTTASCAKKVIKYATIGKETYNKKHYIYDHSTGMYVKLKRPLSSKDISNISTLRNRNPRMTMTSALTHLHLVE